MKTISASLIILLLAALFSFGSYASSAAPIVKLPVPDIETLPNGLEIAWFLNDKLPVVDLAILVKSGSRDDLKGKSGTAELLSSVLDRGAAGMTAHEIAAAIESLGATRYAAADDDAFSLGMHGLAPDAPVLLDLLAKLTLEPTFQPEEVLREKKDLLEHWKHLGDSAETMSSVVFSRRITAGTSYGRGAFSSLAEFDHVNRADLIAFHEKHFTPKNSILMIVGRVNREKFREKILADFGEWKGEAPLHKKINFSDSRLKTLSHQIILVDRPGLTQVQVKMGFQVPGIHSPYRTSLAVGNALLGEYFNSRLNSVIRDKLGLTYSISSAVSYSQEFAYFAVSSATQTATVGKLIEKSTEIIRDMKSGNISADEVAQSKEYLIGGYPLSVSTLGAVASRWLSGYIYNLGPDYLNGFVKKVTEVNQENVIDAVKNSFDVDHMVIVIAGDAKETRKSLAASGYKNIKLVTIKDLQ